MKWQICPYDKWSSLFLVHLYAFNCGAYGGMNAGIATGCANSHSNSYICYIRFETKRKNVVGREEKSTFGVSSGFCLQFFIYVYIYCYRSEDMLSRLEKCIFCSCYVNWQCVLLSRIVFKMIESILKPQCISFALVACFQFSVYIFWFSSTRESCPFQFFLVFLIEPPSDTKERSIKQKQEQKWSTRTIYSKIHRMRISKSIV